MWRHSLKYLKLWNPSVRRRKEHRTQLPQGGALRPACACPPGGAGGEWRGGGVEEVEERGMSDVTAPSSKTKQPEGAPEGGSPDAHTLLYLK